MDDELFLPDRLAEAIAAVDATGGPEALPDVLSTIMPGFERVMTRVHWYRLGGVVDGDYQRTHDRRAGLDGEIGDLANFDASGSNDPGALHTAPILPNWQAATRPR